MFPFRKEFPLSEKFDSFVPRKVRLKFFYPIRINRLFKILDWFDEDPKMGPSLVSEELEEAH